MKGNNAGSSCKWEVCYEETRDGWLLVNFQGHDGGLQLEDMHNHPLDADEAEVCSCMHACMHAGEQVQRHAHILHVGTRFARHCIGDGAIYRSRDSVVLLRDSTGDGERRLGSLRHPPRSREGVQPAWAWHALLDTKRHLH